MSLNFYRAFEDRFRGTRELIKSRLQIYKPFIEPLSHAHPDAIALDLGCGRGEWLELLIECGFNAKGVDLDEGMLEACRTLKLDVEQGDALAYLESQDDQSHIIVSAFHVVEHINFAQLNHLVTQALRVLKPGGLLIMETPNSENILVGTSSFYLDPSHQRPIPSPLLSFVAEHAGFDKVKILGLQESAEIQQKNEVSLRDVLGGVSPDYAVIAQKKPQPTDVITISDAFDVDYGLSLDKLVRRWDMRAERIEIESRQAAEQSQRSQMESCQAQEQAKNAQAQADKAFELSQQAQAYAGRALEQAEQAKEQAQQALVRSTQAQEQAQQIQQQLLSLYASKSWRMTAPLRRLMQTLRHFKKS